jgi:hypothetical protein
MTHRKTKPLCTTAHNVGVHDDRLPNWCFTLALITPTPPRGIFINQFGVGTRKLPR